MLFHMSRSTFSHDPVSASIPESNSCQKWMDDKQFSWPISACHSEVKPWRPSNLPSRSLQRTRKPTIYLRVCPNLAQPWSLHRDSKSTTTAWAVTLKPTTFRFRRSTRSTRDTRPLSLPSQKSPKASPDPNLSVPPNPFLGMTDRLTHFLLLCKNNVSMYSLENR